MAQLGLEPAESPYLNVFNNAVTDIPAGRAVVLDTAGGGALFDTWVRLPTDAETGLVPLGLTTQVIPSKTWGFVTVRPGMRVPCKSGAAVAKGVYVKASSVAGQNGKIILAADGDAYVGSSLNATAGADEDILVLFGRGAHALG
jgi:hypothetical protein